MILKVWFYGNSIKLRQSPTHALGKTSALTEHVAEQDHREALCVPAQQKIFFKNGRKADDYKTTKKKGATKRLEVVKWIVNEDLPLSKFQSMIPLLKELKTPDIDMSEEECPSYESWKPGHAHESKTSWKHWCGEGFPRLGRGKRTQNIDCKWSLHDK